VIDSSQLTYEQRQMLRQIIVSATGRAGVVPQIEAEGEEG
jgi:hypothetical protein